MLPALDTLRSIHGGYARRNDAVPLMLTFGLYQGYKLGAAAQDGYVRALNGLLLPRLLVLLENQMSANLDKPEVLYQALKVYLILGRQGPMDADLVKQWLGLAFTLRYPGEDAAPARASLDQHLAAMLENPLDEGGAERPAGGPGARHPHARAVRRVCLQSPAAELRGAGAAGMDGGRQCRPGRRAGVRAARRQTDHNWGARVLHL